MKSPAKVVLKGVSIPTSDQKKKTFGIFNTSDPGKIILIDDPKTKDEVVSKIEELRALAV